MFDYLLSQSKLTEPEFLKYLMELRNYSEEIAYMVNVELLRECHTSEYD